MPIARPHYMWELESYRDTPQVKVLSGVRRCGKSTLLEMLFHNLQKTVPAENMLFLRCDSASVPLNPTAEWLDEQVHAVLTSMDSGHKAYFFFDEIQEIPGWERVVRRLHTETNTDIYITGSNAFLLSSDLATYLSGRYVEIPVFPLSFQEYLDFSGRLDSSDSVTEELFEQYLRYGGMPGLFALRSMDPISIARELQAIHDTVILNDVAKRFNIRDLELLEKLVRYVFSTSGNLFSTRKIVGALQSSNRKVYADTIESYLDALERAFLIYPCEQEGIQGKDVLRPLRKLYAPDTGLRNLEIGFRRQDIGFQLESVVRMELARQGFRVTVGTLKNGEVDFIARNGDQTLYIQAAQSVIDPATMEREANALRDITDAHPKMILTLDRIGLGTTPDGIRVENLIDWLLDYRERQ